MFSGIHLHTALILQHFGLARQPPLRANLLKTCAIRAKAQDARIQSRAGDVVTDKAATAPARITLLGTLVGGLILGALAITFVLSFAAIVFAGPAAVYLETGIAHALLGAGVMALAGATGYSFRGVLCQPQDVTAIVLAGATAGYVATRSADAAALPATLVQLVALAAAGAGLGSYLCGRFRVGALARYLPFPVVAGFLSATGVLLVLGAIGMCLKAPVSLLDPGPMITVDGLWRWGPWLLGAVALSAAMHRMPGDRTLPTALLALLAGFYLWLAGTGLSLEDAAERGLLLGPFEGASFAAALRPNFALTADWRVLLFEAPTLLAIAALALIGSLLNGAGLERAMGQDGDPEADLRATGRANLAAALVGGLPGYQIIGETLLAHKLRLTGALPAILTAAACWGALLIGARALENLPIGFFAAVVGFLGVDLIREWLWQQRHRLGPRDMALVLGIVGVAVTVGFLQALVIGLVLSVVMFLAAYSRLTPIRLQSTAAHRRSRVERSRSALDRLAAMGERITILELQGYLFFGTAHRLRQDVRAVLTGDRPGQIVMDLAHVTGIDASARDAFDRIAEDCARAGVALTISSAPDALDLGQAARFPTLDAALEQIEAGLLRDQAAGEPVRQTTVLLDTLFADARAARHLTETAVAPGVHLIRQGHADTRLYALVEGRMRAEIDTASGGKTRVALFEPGALIGELAYYAGLPRSADVVAETPCRVVGIDIDALQADSPEAAGRLHAHVARLVAARLVRMNALARDAGF